jgi:TPR repeat protein
METDNRDEALERLGPLRSPRPPFWGRIIYMFSLQVRGIRPINRQLHLEAVMCLVGLVVIGCTKGTGETTPLARGSAQPEKLAPQTNARTTEQASPGLASAIEARKNHDYATAIKEFSLSAAQGNAEAAFLLGNMYDAGEGVPRDFKEAARWYLLAAEHGYADAQVNLGEMYSLGRGVPQDYKESARWNQLAARSGNASAQYNLGNMFDNGQGVLQDYQEAARWYALAAQQGDVFAQFALGDMHRKGMGVPQDLKEAARWYRAAGLQPVPTDPAPNIGGRSWAQQDEGETALHAQLNLGNMYTGGQGVPQDDKEAVRWYRLAAERGLALAQYYLGDKYENGHGVGQDYAEAARWYRLAAEQGEVHGQFYLGAAYAKGQGVPENYIQAYMWFSLAGVSGDADGIKLRDIVADGMTPEQIADAQLLVQQWKPKTEKTPSGH